MDPVGAGSFFMGTSPAALPRAPYRRHATRAQGCHVLPSGTARQAQSGDCSSPARLERLAALGQS